MLTNGFPVTGVSGASTSSQNWTMDVPAGKAVTFTISGGTGDADMYVKFGSAPTTTMYDCRPCLSGSDETCHSAKTTAGKLYIMLGLFGRDAQGRVLEHRPV